MSILVNKKDSDVIIKMDIEQAKLLMDLFGEFDLRRIEDIVGKSNNCFNPTFNMTGRVYSQLYRLLDGDK